MVQKVSEVHHALSKMQPEDALVEIWAKVSLAMLETLLGIIVGRKSSNAKTLISVDSKPACITMVSYLLTHSNIKSVDSYPDVIFPRPEQRKCFT
jgi:hypothetical protein